MSNIQLNFNQRPGIAGAMAKALFLPRKGFDASVGMPDISATWKNATINKVDLDKYLEVLGITASDQLPVLYPHVMAGAVHMKMLTHKAFPIRLLGALHLKNRIIQHKPINLSASFDLFSSIADLKKKKKGVEFDFVTTIKIDNDVVWEEVSTYFMAGRFGGKENPSPERSFELESLSSSAAEDSWFVPKNRGKVYAKITGDYNPIHISKPLAKLFGFKRDIAHGFGVLAQGIQQSKVADAFDGQRMQIDVIFKGPVYLENDVQLQSNATQDKSRFDIYCGDNPKPSICFSILEYK